MYFLFAGEYYYPGGGIADYIDTFDSVEAAKKFFNKAKYSWAEIGTLKDNKLIEIWFYRSGEHFAGMKLDGWNES